MGQISPIMKSRKILPARIDPKGSTPPPPEDERYLEVTDALKMSLRQGSFRAGELLTQVAEEKLFGHWRTFKNYVVGEQRITEVQAYRLMFAFEVLKVMGKKRLPLPVNERQVRPLRILRTQRDDMILAWKRACKQKQYGQPTYLDVQREVNRLRRSESSRDEVQAYYDYRGCLEGIKTELRRATEIMASGDLEALLRPRILGHIPRPKRVLIRMMIGIGITLSDHFRKVTGEEMSFEGRD